MRSILLGKDAVSGADIHLPREAFGTHIHLIGGTGKGKTTAIHTMLHPLLTDAFDKSCFFIIDRLGNFSQELLLWISSRFCTDEVRKRLVYIQPSREDVVPTFNPLQYESSAHGYYKVERATEIILRAWESVNIEAMPRLARWTFNAFWAAAQLGLTISDCSHFLMPGSPYHRALLDLLPERLKAEWQEITGAKGQEATRILDSSRNRLKPYFESDILRRMFGSTKSRLNVLRMMEEGKIVILDLAPRNRLSGQLANTIGSLIINEIIATVRSLPRTVKYRTYLFLDEFQNFVGPDLISALPETRQMGLNLILSHQSFAQLERGDYDLTNMIFTAQSRMIFGLQGEDADILAHEVASLTFDPRKIKEEMYSRRQMIERHRIEILKAWSQAKSDSSQWSESDGADVSMNEGQSRNPDSLLPTLSTGAGRSNKISHASGGAKGLTNTVSGHETLVPEYEQFLELSSRTYETFDEQKNVWAREIRNLSTGQALLRLVNDSRLYRLNVRRSTPGFLNYDIQTVARKFPESLDRMDRLLEENFQSDFFASAASVDVEAQQRLENVLKAGRVRPENGESKTSRRNGRSAESPFQI